MLGSRIIYFFFIWKEVCMKNTEMSMEEWREYLGISEDDGTVPEDDVEGEWEDVRKL